MRIWGERRLSIITCLISRLLSSRARIWAQQSGSRVSALNQYLSIMTIATLPMYFLCGSLIFHRHYSCTPSNYCVQGSCHPTHCIEKEKLWNTSTWQYLCFGELRQGLKGEHSGRCHCETLKAAPWTREDAIRLSLWELAAFSGDPWEGLRRVPLLEVMMNWD